MKKSLKIALLFLTTLILVTCGGSSKKSPGGDVSIDRPAPPQISITNATGNEGSTINFSVSITYNNSIEKGVSFDYRIDFDNPLTLSSATTSDINLNSLTGTSTIASTDIDATISIAIADDLLRETDETFMVVLSNLSPSDGIFIDNIGEGTILANDATGIVTLSVADVEASEDSRTIKFKVTSNFSHSQDITFGYEVVFK